ncbi:hypothetical protein DPMN_085669 [Dreissena polymorpha]|uniref:Uncharacterized protein n=1 Tax=Dreissena polymorpha TaxID=45954 RepID=A0A9D3YD41_DREPO|nr:hypothetical protein DPMN_085669 [Dreissena polymorpha]
MDISKTAVHAGLRKELKQLSNYQCDKIGDYDEFKRELRKIEAEIKESVAASKPCMPAIQVEIKEQNILFKTCTSTFSSIV